MTGKTTHFTIFAGTLAMHLGKRRARTKYSTRSKVQDGHIAEKHTSKTDFGSYFMPITFEIQTFFNCSIYWDVI